MIRVGTAGWSYPDWEGIVYPRRKPRGFHPLRHLARYVDCVEINASFYAPLDAENTRRWLACVSDRPQFRFTAKLHRSFTHEPLEDSDAALTARAEDFLAGLEPLRSARLLSGVLVQFPLSFVWGAPACARLERLAASLARVPLVLEVRHKSWFEREPLERIERLGYSLARIDLPASDSHPPADPPALGPLAYVRLHGRNTGAWFARGASRDQRYDYLYAPQELDEIVQLVRRLAQGSDETVVITNNHFSGKAVANALEILAGLGRRPSAPAELVTAFPRLAGVTAPDGQQPLFG